MLSFALGRQIAVDFYDCLPERLNDCAFMQEICESSAREAGATVLSSSFHNFTPQGVSGVVVIAESHFAVHAWPEFRFAALDIFTCSESVDFDVACSAFAAKTGASSFAVRGGLCRGELNNGQPKKTESIDYHKILSRTTPSWEKIYTADTHCGMSLIIDICGCSNINAPGVFADSFALPAKDVVIRRNTSTGCINIDIFKSGFIDPRPVAESAMAEFCGARYTLQVIMRP